MSVSPEINSDFLSKFEDENFPETGPPVFNESYLQLLKSTETLSQISENKKFKELAKDTSLELSNIHILDGEKVEEIDGVIIARFKFLVDDNIKSARIVGAAVFLLNTHDDGPQPQLLDLEASPCTEDSKESDLEKLNKYLDPSYDTSFRAVFEYFPTLDSVFSHSDFLSQSQSAGHWEIAKSNLEKVSTVNGVMLGRVKFLALPQEQESAVCVVGYAVVILNANNENRTQVCHVKCRLLGHLLTGVETLESFKSSREATEIELVGIEKPARAIAELFLKADDGDFSFALFGKWGRGKTTLINKVADNLHKTRGDQKVYFSAWQYRKTPEIWAFLYETVKDTLSSSGGWKAKIRSGMCSHGYWPLTFLFISIMLAVLPQGKSWETLVGFTGNILPFFGTAGVLLTARIYTRSKKHVDFLREKYLNYASHKDKLGLKAILGEDFKSLIIGNFPRSYLALRGGRLWPFLVSLTAVSLTLIYINDEAYQQPYLVSLFNETVGVLKPSDLGLPLKTLFSWSLAGLFAYFLLLTTGQEEEEKLLLIIDDLDRCSHEEILNIIESLVTFIQDEEIARRLQIAFLIEEAALRLALYKKYKDLIHTTSCQNVNGRKSIREDDEKVYAEESFDYPSVSKVHLNHYLINENFEKFFLCWYRLIDLEKEAVEKITDNFFKANCLPLESEENSEQRSTTGTPGSNEERTAEQEKPLSEDDDTQQNQDKSTEENRRGQENDKEKTTGNHARLSDPVIKKIDLNAEERKEITEVLKEYSSDLITPRFIRAFIFKYQLVKLLKDGKGVSPKELLTYMSKGEGWEELDKVYERIK